MTVFKLTAPLGEVLGVLSRELDMLAGMSRSAQAVVAQLLTTSRTDLLEGGGTELQQLDMITQHLEDLAPFLGALARSVPETCHVDLAETTQIRLAGLAHRLRCEPPSEATPAAPAPGDADWF